MKKMVLSVSAAVVALVVACIAVAIVRPEWVPAWARLKTAQAKDYGLYCEEHGVPEKFCTICHPELKDKLLLCPEHGNIPEDICTLCHPELKEKHDIEVCPEHGLPKHFCSKCEEKSGKPQASSNLFDDGWCVAFGETTGEGKKVCQLLPMVRLASADLSGEVGIKTAPVAEEEHVHELLAPAQTAYDANRYAEITPRVSAFVREARFDLGQKVRAGEVVAVVDSAEVSTAKAQYLSGKAALTYEEDNYRRVDFLTKVGRLSVPSSEPLALFALNQARATTLGAEQKLRNFRFDDAALADILKTSDTKPLLEITSPIEGTVVFATPSSARGWTPPRSSTRSPIPRSSGSGLTSSSGTSGTSSRGSRSPSPSRARPQRARRAPPRARLPGSAPRSTRRPGPPRSGPSSPTRKGRSGPTSSARPGFCSARSTRPSPCPRGPCSGTKPRTWCSSSRSRASTARNESRRSRSVGRDVVEVSWGLKPGEEVVTAGAFLLKTEIMKGSIGAGCCD